MGITLKDVRLEHDSNGGVGVQATLVNNNPKPIDYVVFSVQPYNDGGYTAKCSVSGKSKVNFNISASIRPHGEYSFKTIKPLWYNSSISSIQPTRAEVRYADGTTEMFLASEINLEKSGSKNKKSGVGISGVGIYVFFKVIFPLICIVLALIIAAFSSGGSSSSRSSSSSNSLTCRVCGRSFSDDSNKRSIRLNNMCNNCYKNFKYANGQKVDDYIIDYYD